MLRIGEAAFEELVAIGDGEELCGRLLASLWGWGSSTRHAEAVELLASVQGTSELPMSFVALMVCTCRRWNRVTMRLIAAIQDSGLLDGAALDELAESLLSHEQVISYPLAWVSSQDLNDAHSISRTVEEDTLAHHRVCVKPPLRRWAAQRALRLTPARLDELLRAAELFKPRDRDALIHGLLDGATCSTNLAAAACSTAVWAPPGRACAGPRLTACQSSTAPRQHDAEQSTTPTPRCGNGERRHQNCDRPCSTRNERTPTDAQQG